MKQETTPQEVLALIEIAVEERKADEEKKRLQEIEEARKVKAEKAEEFDALFEKVQNMIPDVIFPHMVYGILDESKYNLSGWEKAIQFHIPNLAPIAMVFDCHASFPEDESPVFVAWMVAGIRDADWSEDQGYYTTVEFTFHKDYSEREKQSKTNIRKVLWAASEEMNDRNTRQIEIDQEIIRRRLIQERLDANPELKKSEVITHPFSEPVKEYLKEHLDISLSRAGYNDDLLYVSVMFDGDEIASDSVRIA